MIEVSNLVKRYGDHVVLDHLSFTVKPGQIYGFLGPNGAGKSTTMNILTGYIGMTEGSVKINGHDLLEEPEAVRRSIGYLPELPPLYGDMTPREYLTFAAELKKLPRGERPAAVEEVMELTGLVGMQNRLIRNLSKGYRQRVGLAQAILGMPELIILDEPTVGLDPQQIIDIRNLIRSLAGKHTVILSSHILTEVQEVCDHILILHHGQLVADGTPEELERSLRDNILDITLKSESPSDAEALAASLPDVSRWELRNGSGEYQLALYPKEGADLREAVFNACVERKLPLLGMQYRTTGLEQVFLRLINDDLPAPSAGDSLPEETPTDAEALSASLPDVNRREAPDGDEACRPDPSHKEGADEE